MYWRMPWWAARRPGGGARYGPPTDPPRRGAGPPVDYSDSYTVSSC